MSLRNGYTLGNWTVFPLESRMVNDQVEERVQPKAMDVLLCLAMHESRLVERAEILRQVWSEWAPSDEPLTRCIGDLRRALGDTPNEHRYIQVLPFVELSPNTAVDTFGSSTSNVPCQARSL